MRDAENGWKTDALWYTNKLPIWCGLQFQLCLSRIIRSAGLTAQKIIPGFHISNLLLIVFSMCPNSKTHETIGALIFLPVLLTLRDQITFGPSGRWRLRRNLHATRALQMHLSVWILKTSKNANFLDQPTRLGKQSSLHWSLSLLFHVWIVHTISHPGMRKNVNNMPRCTGSPKPKTYPSHTAFASSGGKGNAVSPECGVEHLLEIKSRDNLNGTVTFTCHLESCHLNLVLHQPFSNLLKAILLLQISKPQGQVKSTSQAPRWVLSQKHSTWQQGCTVMPTLRIA